uniref:Uncharacterized protein n=1 Tax=Sphaerodactylus townsendi TaxID=933632 RepID=A0ACB8ESC0_9SAUR
MEAATDSFKVNEKPSEKIKLVNTEVPSGVEQDTRRMQMDQNLLDSEKVSEHNSYSSYPHHNPVMEKIQTEDEEKENSAFVQPCPEESALTLLSFASCNKERDLKSSASSRQAVKYASSEAESLEIEETSSVSTEDEISDVESSEGGLEPGEITLVREGFGEERMKIF